MARLWCSRALSHCLNEFFHFDMMEVGSSNLPVTTNFNFSVKCKVKSVFKL